MPKVLNAAGRKAAAAYAVTFLANYDAALLALAIKTLTRGVGSKAGSATGFKLSSRVNTSFAEVKRGCKSAEVKLHPHTDVYSEMGGSDAITSVPQALVDIKAFFPGEKFISGHVLNAEFGGVGSNPANQTVLTSGANSQHHFDEHVKSAWIYMTRAWEEMYRFAGDATTKSYMKDLRESWAIHIQATVDDSSWYAAFKADPAITTPYPLDCVTTQVTFTAAEVNGPTEKDIADELKIDPDKLGDVARYLSAFREHMSQATKFVVKQAPPASLAGRSPVSADMTDGSGKTTTKSSNAWQKTLKVPKGKKKGAAAPKPAVKTVQSYFTLADGSEIALLDGDNEIGAETVGYPWSVTDTDLKADAVFCVFTDTASGKALISLEPKVKTKVTVDGAALTTTGMTLSPGDVVRVPDSKAPNTDHCYDLTFGQR